MSAHERMMHVSADKEWLIGEIVAHGARKVLSGWTGTNLEAIAALVATPGFYVVLDSTCDNRRPDGGCAGHQADGRPLRALELVP